MSVSQLHFLISSESNFKKYNPPAVCIFYLHIYILFLKMISIGPQLVEELR